MPLVNREHRKIAAHLVAEVGKGKHVYFLESDQRGPGACPTSATPDEEGPELGWPPPRLQATFLHLGALAIILIVRGGPSLAGPREERSQHELTSAAMSRRWAICSPAAETPGMRKAVGPLPPDANGAREEMTDPFQFDPAGQPPARPPAAAGRVWVSSPSDSAAVRRHPAPPQPPCTDDRAAHVWASAADASRAAAAVVARPRLRPWPRR